VYGTNLSDITFWEETTEVRNMSWMQPFRSTYRFDKRANIRKESTFCNHWFYVFPLRIHSVTMVTSRCRNSIRFLSRVEVSIRRIDSRRSRSIDSRRSLCEVRLRVTKRELLGEVAKSMTISIARKVTLVADLVSFPGAARKNLESTVPRAIRHAGARDGLRY